jgi:peptide/nickel transport system permease protein
MQRYILSRVVQSIFLLVGVLFITFFMIRLTGDPARLLLAREASQEQVQAFRQEMGFNRPLVVQFFDYLGSVLSGDLGRSITFRQSSRDIILERLPATVQLAVTSLIIAFFVAVPLGIVGGSSPGSWMDTAARSVGLLGQAMPNFWLALLLIIVFAVKLRWFPTFGRDSAASIVLPAVASSVGPIGRLVRLTRSSVLEIRHEDYIRTARSKGLSRFAISTRHVLRNASLVLLSVVGLQFAFILSGSVYIETIFAWPGIGNLLNSAIGARDFPLVQAITLFIATFAIFTNLVVDLLYGVVDPRIRYGH